MTATTRPTLPVADSKTVRDFVRALLRSRRRPMLGVVAWFALATVCGLAIPALVGDLVDRLATGASIKLPLIMLAFAAFLLVQAVLTRTARLAAAKLGEATLSSLRVDFVHRVMAVPVSMVEDAGSGDFISRMSRDVNAMSNAVRTGAPSILIAGVSVILTVIATAVVSPLALLCSLVVVPVFFFSCRWYLRRARPAYLAQSAAYADLTDALTETVAGAKTVEALGRQQIRMGLTDDRIAAAYAAECATLRLRTGWFPAVDIGYYMPVIATLLVGGLGYTRGWVSLGAVVTSVLYARALIDPLDELLTWLDELQVASASLARIIGVEQAAEPAVESAAQPVGSEIVAREVRFAYRPGHDVLIGIDLALKPGERLAIVGPSGAGKSTLGRLLAGVNAPASGTITCGGVELTQLSITDRRREVALVTQEHHIFIGTIRDNVALAKPGADDDAVFTALDAVDAGWVRDLAEGLDTEVGAGGHGLTPGQAQQIALSRVVLGDPHTVVLDEATAALDPRAARHLERSLAAVLAGRTVVAIAHRLHTAYDADRVAVMDHGRIVEIGSHDDLLAREGRYSALWTAWHVGTRN